MKVKWHACVSKVGTRKGALSTDQILRMKVWVRAYLLGPERWWSMPEKGEAGETLVEARSDTDVQIVRLIWV